MRARVWILALLIGIGLLVAEPSLSWGADPAAPLDEHAKAVNRAAQTPEGERRVVEHLSKELNVPAATLRAQREHSKLGWGELSIANRLSQKTGVPVEQLIAEHKSGKGWGVIAKERHVKLGPIVSEVKKSHQALEARVKNHPVEKADKSEMPGKESKRPDVAADPGGKVGGPGPGAGHGRGRGK